MNNENRNKMMNEMASHLIHEWNTSWAPLLERIVSETDLKDRREAMQFVQTHYHNTAHARMRKLLDRMGGDEPWKE